MFHLSITAVTTLITKKNNHWSGKFCMIHQCIVSSWYPGSSLNLTVLPHLHVAYDLNMADIKREICEYPGNARSKVWKWYFGFYITREGPATKENMWNTFSRLIRLYVMINWLGQADYFWRLITKSQPIPNTLCTLQFNCFL